VLRVRCSEPFDEAGHASVHRGLDIAEQIKSNAGLICDVQRGGRIDTRNTPRLGGHSGCGLLTDHGLIRAIQARWFAAGVRRYGTMATRITRIEITSTPSVVKRSVLP
jgi:hypothetical protein